MAPLVAALVSALLMWASFPPLGFGLLVFVAPAPLLWGLRRLDSGMAAAAVGFVWGAAFFGATLNWIFVLGAVAWFPLTIWLGITSAILSVAIWAFRSWTAARWWLVAVGAWGLWEIARASFPLGGFPWGAIGYAAAGNPGAIGAVQWIGPFGWMALAVAVSAGLVLAIEDRANWRFLVDPVVVVTVVALAGWLFPPEAGGGGLRTAIVQGNSPCPGTRCDNENQRIFESHLALTSELPTGGVDFVVWPENSTGPPFDPTVNDDVRALIAEQAMRLRAYILVSGTRSVGDTEFENVNIMFDPAGNVVDEYLKRHPVPFGEYVPLRGLLDFIPQLDRVPRDMIRGDGPVTFRAEQGTIGSVISYEGAYAGLIRSEARAGAELMVVATNEASFGRGAASDQLIAMTRVNAAAVGQYLVHAAITGRSAFITPAGVILDDTDLFTTSVIVERMAFRDGAATIYTRYGDWALLVAAVAAIAAVTAPGEGRPKGRRARRA